MLLQAILIVTLIGSALMPAHAEDATNVTAAVVAAVKDNTLTMSR